MRALMTRVAGIPDYPELVRALLNPEAYSDAVSTVELVETHISYLFLTGAHVYKVKKSVDYGFLDFTTLEKRKYFCEQEVELNRRLSPSVYLGVSEVRLKDGIYKMDGPGETVEYAVKMRQLPQERALDKMLSEGKIPEGAIQRLAEKIARFHQQAETSPDIRKLGGWTTVKGNLEENFSQMEKYMDVALSKDMFDVLMAYSRAFLQVKKAVFERRASEGYVKDCHGDLHTAQVFLENGIRIIDCIEFNRRFRYSDVAADIAFMAMDLDFHRRPDLSELFVGHYIKQTGDHGLRELLGFFKIYRVYTRGKVNCLRLDNPNLNEREVTNHLTQARSYFQLAHSYINRLEKPALILVTGLTGTGKTTMAQELARRWNLAHLSSDVIRKEVAGLMPTEHRYEAPRQGIYSREFSRRTYDAMTQRAESYLARGRSVVLDATFRRASERKQALTMAKKMEAETWIVECTLPEEQIKGRMEQRFAESTSPSDARWELYHTIKEEWEPIIELPSGRHIMLDTSPTVHEAIVNLLQQLYEGMLKGQD